MLEAAFLNQKLILLPGLHAHRLHDMFASYGFCW